MRRRCSKSRQTKLTSTWLLVVIGRYDYSSWGNWSKLEESIWCRSERQLLVQPWRPMK
jgi:hypothetical protein